MAKQQFPFGFCGGIEAHAWGVSFSYNNAPHSSGILDGVFLLTAWHGCFFLADFILLNATTVLGSVRGSVSVGGSGRMMISCFRT